MIRVVGLEGTHVLFGRPNGQMRIMPMGERDMAPLMKRAKRVPRGTVFFMHDGQLYTMQGAGMMFDRAGNWKTH